MALGSERVALCMPLFCVFFLSVLLLLLFALFAVLLNCPYPDPPVLPFSSHSPAQRGGGRGNGAAALALCCQPGLEPVSWSLLCLAAILFSKGRSGKSMKT